MKKIKVVLIIFSLVFSKNMALGQILFEDQASILGINANTYSDGNGLGISFADYDGDGLDDITIPSRFNEPLKFFKNISGFYIEEQLLVPQITYPTRSVSWVDYDNDGDKDLFVVSDTNGSRLYDRQNDGALRDATLSSGLFTDNVSTFSVSWGDINNDGCLDLFFANRSTDSSFPNLLFQNNCDGTFNNISMSAGISTDARLTFGSAFFDYDNDGFQDLYLINDKTTSNRLYRNNGDNTFSDVSEITGAGITIDAMSVTIGDYNNDSFFDIYITNTDIEYPGRVSGSVLLQNINGTSFQDVTSTVSAELDGWCWGANFLDADNDSDLDLYVSCLYVSPPNPSSYGFYENLNLISFSQPSNIGFLNNDLSSYGTAIGDADNDGKVDILVVNDGGNLPNLWMNRTTTSNNYLKVNLTGVQSNKDGVGSIIEISTNGNKQYRCVINGESYLSQNSFTEFFGVGDETTIDYLKVKWLSGVEDIFYNVSSNQTISIVEGSGALALSDFSETSLQLFPNPSNYKITIQSNTPIDFFELYDAQGRKVKFGKINQLNFSFDLSSLESGTYIMAISSNKNKVFKKIIKQ